MKVQKNIHNSILYIFVIQILVFGIYVSSLADVTPIGDRTEEVRDAIVSAAGVNSADDVTDAHLAAITALDLRGDGITKLKLGDFSGLTGLTNLNLYNNELSSLPDGIFEGLTALTTLRLGGNAVDPLPIRVSLEKVGSDQFKVVVPIGAPSDIVVPVSATNSTIAGDVTTLTVSIGSTESTAVTVSQTTNTSAAVNANIGTLPGLPANHYGYVLSKSDDLPLTIISSISTPVSPTPTDPIPPADLSVNSAPEFIDGTTTTRSVLENTGAGMNIGSTVAATDGNDTLTYSLGGSDAVSFDIDTETGQLKTKVALDYEMKQVYVVTITVSDGELTDTISVSIRVVDVAETNLSSTELAVSDRTAEVRDAIVAAVGVSDASDVTADHLAAITNLDLRVKSITSLQTGDFSGLSGLTGLNLYGNMLISLPNGIFEGLTSLTSLRLGGNSVDPMPLTVSLQHVTDNQYKVVIPAGAPYDVVISISGADVTTITISKGSLASSEFTGTASANIGDLPSLPANHYGYILAKSDVCNRTLQVSDVITAAVPGIDDCRNVTDVHLASITALDLSSQSLSSLQSNDLTGLLSLTSLNLADNQLSTLPDGVFSDLRTLTLLNLTGNSVDPLPISVVIQKVGTDQFKVVIPTGAPFTMMLPISISNGSISGDVEMVTISAGTMESSNLTVIRTVNTFNAVSVDISTLPSLPTGHTGYALSKSNQTSLEIFSEINVAPVFTEGASTSRNVAENTAAGENIGSAISAADRNNDTLTYSLGGTNAAAFDIDESSGQLKTKASLDFEFKSTYTVTVTVSDSALTDTITVTINVTDIDETTGNFRGVDIRDDGQPNNDPIFSDGSSTSRSIAENTGSGVDIGAPVSATDSDVDDTLLYSLGGTDAGSFSIDSTNGQLRTSAPLDYEQTPSYTVVVSVDDGQGSSDSITVTINIIDVNEDPANSAPSFTEGDSTTRRVAENTGSGVDIGDPIEADDDDADDTLRYSLGGSDAGSFSINSTNGQLRTSAALDYEATQSYSVVVSVSDGEGGSDSITVTINVIDVNETPVNNSPEFTDSDPTTRSVAENTSSGVDIGSAVSATDSDGDTLSYSLGGVDASSFDIDSETGQLRTSAALDHESDSSYDVTVNVSDNNGGSDSIGVTINVTDVNEAPEFTDGVSTSRTIAEKVGPGINIGSAVGATDPENDDLTYTLGGTNATSFDIESDTGQLKTKAVLDYEEKSSYSVTVSVTDGSLNDSIPVTITVKDLDETPSNIPPEFTDGTTATRSVPENTAAGENIRDAISAEDDDSPTLFYLLSGTDASSFSIDDSTGQLKTNAALNFEGKQSYQVTVTVSDGSSTDTITVTINVTNVNEAPVFDTETARREVDENTDAGQNIGQPFSAEDPDVGDILSYSLEGTDAAAFDIGSATGQLQTKAALDFEDKTTYSVIVKVSDSEGLFDILTLTVNVRDIDENRAPTFTDGTDTERSVDENTGSCVDIGDPVAATDDDSDDTLEYSLGGTDAASFDIDSTSGQLRTKAALDFETKASYTVIVSVTDNNGGNASINVTIKVNDVQENRVPTFTDGASTERSVDENTGSGVNIGDPVSATDDDSDDTLEYSLGGTDAASFDIDTTNGQLRTKAALDFEDTNTYSVIVSVTDNEGGRDSINVTIRVNDVQENRVPTFTDGTATERSVDENTGSGVDIGAAVSATDDDPGDTLNYSLGGTDAASFDIDSTSGQLRTKVALDFEDTNTYSVVVSVTDNNGGEASINVTIKVNDVDENRAPTFTDGTDTTRSVAENTSAGADISAAVSATDQDNDTLEYTLEGVDAASFDIDSTNGQLKTKAALDYEMKDEYSVVVKAADDSLSTTIAVTIEISDVNEAPVFTDGSSTSRLVAENTSAGEDIGPPVSAKDPEEDSLVYTLEGVDAASFDIDSTNGQLQTKAALDYETDDEYSVIVKASDDSLSSTIAVTIEVTDVSNEVLSTTKSVSVSVTDTTSTITPVNERTQQVQDAIVNAAGLNSADEVTEEHLAAITVSLNLSDSNLTSLKSGDFDGLSNLQFLSLYNNALSSLPSDIFDELINLTFLDLNSNALSSLQSGVFEELTKLTTLRLGSNAFNSFSTDIFGDLTNLSFLGLSSNGLSSLPSGIFDALENLTILELYDNDLSSLPSGIFDALKNLKKLRLYSNELSSLPSGIFDNMTELTQLNLSENELSSLLSDVFGEQTNLIQLYLNDNALSSLPSGIFDELTDLIEIYLNDNVLSSLPSEIFNELTALKRLSIDSNELTSLPSGIFDELTVLSNLTLSGNELTSLPSGIFDELTNLTRLLLNKNELTDISELEELTSLEFLFISDNPISDYDPLRRLIATIEADGRRLWLDMTIPAGAPAKIIPTRTSLLTNYPNPFNPETWIPYQLSKSSHVTMTIYNMRGVVVRELALGYKPAGYYTTRKRAAYWDGRNNIGEKVAAGLYFCTFKAGDFTATRKMLIRK